MLLHVLTYSVFYFLSTLSTIIYKTYVLSYPDGRLALDMCLLFLMASLEVLRVGNLQESESYTASNLIATGATVLLALYFVIWQSYVLRADVIIDAGLCYSYYVKLFPFLIHVYISITYL
uniref:Transmembrane protein 80 n=1 Tax=Sinocyclocheilus anshuiensis TaxID=1608454 RepID=A0A671S9Z1_9TELE